MICLPPINKVLQYFNKMSNRCVVCLADFPHEWDICNTFRCCSAKWCNDCEVHIYECPQCRSQHNTTLTYGQLHHRYENAQETIRKQDSAIKSYLTSMKQIKQDMNKYQTFINQMGQDINKKTQENAELHYYIKLVRNITLIILFLSIINTFLL